MGSKYPDETAHVGMGFSQFKDTFFVEGWPYFILLYYDITFKRSLQYDQCFHCLKFAITLTLVTPKHAEHLRKKVLANYAMFAVRYITEGTQEMPQSRSTALTRHQKRERWGTNKDKTNAIYETTDAQTKKNYKRGITKTYLYNFDPLKPHFYIVKLGFTGVYIIFLISAQKHRLWLLVRTASPRRF